MSDSGVSNNNDSFDIAQDLLDFSMPFVNDQGEHILKWIEKWTLIRSKLSKQNYKLADLLDATITRHSDEMDKCKQHYENKLNEMKDEVARHLLVLNELTIENQSKTEAYDRLVNVLRSIYGRKCHIYIFFLLILI